MDNERRRFFRINETVGIAWHVLEGAEMPRSETPSDLLSLFSEQDHKIEKLLIELEDENPKVAELIALFNQKLERVVQQFMLDSGLVARIANKVKEANLSACGIAFINEEAITEGADLRMELTLYPSQRRIHTDGRVVGCDNLGNQRHYWRIDFYGMSKADQEDLIQHIVRSQSQQLKTIRQY